MNTARVLHVIAPSPLGGAESVVRALASAADEPALWVLQAAHEHRLGLRGEACESLTRVRSANTATALHGLMGCASTPRSEDRQSGQ